MNTAKALVAALMVAVAVPATAAPVFHNFSGAVATGDNAWQAAATGLGGALSEQDFESFTNGQKIGPFTIGGVTVSISYPASASTKGEIFAGGFGSNANMVAGKALLNRDENGAAHASMILSFSIPVVGFGTWVFDNNASSAESFTLTANGSTSAPIDNPLPSPTAHKVDGFLGVVDAAGISTVTVNKIGSGSFFELDHMQIAVANVPVPAALPLFASGLAVLGFFGWRRSR